MNVLEKVLSAAELDQLELLLSGALAPLEGYLSQQDHVSVLQTGRLANGYLWPLPLTLTLNAAEKRAAQLSGRILLLDGEKRTIAELKVEQLYRLPLELVGLVTAPADTWYASGAVESHKKRLHAAFNRLRYPVASLRTELGAIGWNSVVAVHADPHLAKADLYQACEWLKQTAASEVWDGGLLVQVSADEQAEDFHNQIRALRSEIRCSAAKQIKLSLLPALPCLNAERRLLLSALIARNYGATAFVVGLAVERRALRYLLQYRDELGLDIIPVRHATLDKVAQLTELEQAA